MIPFGFSVGDFVSGIHLIRELVKALEDTAGSSVEYRDLIKELYSLERALLEVKHLDLDESRHSQGAALQQAASQCQQTIDEFLQNIRKFQPALRAGGSKSPWKDRLRKIEWALYKKEDVQNFRAQLNGHTASINILLMTLQLTTSTIQSQQLDQQRVTNNSHHDGVALANRGIEANKRISNSHTDLILASLKVATSAPTQEQSQDLKDLMLKVLESNLQIYDLILNMHASLPQQVERQQPVMFLDACGRLSPVHLEFITSAEAFLAVLKIRFQDLGLRKIEKGQFALEETKSKRVVNLRRPWHTCFLPGQKIDMSMVFSQLETAKSTCPGCQCESESKAAEDVECLNCGIQYRRIRELDEGHPLRMPLHDAQGVETDSPSMPKSFKRKLPKLFDGGDQDEPQESEELESDPEDEIYRFRRVHIKARGTRGSVQWSAINKHPSLMLDGGGLDVSLTYSTQWPAVGIKGLGVHADRHFDRNFYYFELTVLDHPGIDSGDSTVGIGLSDSSQLHSMPGMVPNSWGFHSDGGIAYQCVGSQMYRDSEFACRWGKHVTVGCGWDAVRNQIWYTINGKWLGTAFRDVPPDSLYPTVGVGFGSTPVRVRANFGPHGFRYQFADHQTQFDLEEQSSEPKSYGNNEAPEPTKHKFRRKHPAKHGGSSQDSKYTRPYPSGAQAPSPFKAPQPATGRIPRAVPSEATGSGLAEYNRPAQESLTPGFPPVVRSPSISNQQCSPVWSLSAWDDLDWPFREFDMIMQDLEREGIGTSPTSNPFTPLSSKRPESYELFQHGIKVIDSNGLQLFEEPWCDCAHR